MDVRVKICGITSQADAQAAVQAGADALGFMFYEKSPRFLTAAAAAEIIATLPPFVARVGVFVDPTEERVGHTAMACNLSTIQLHGEESPEFCARLALPVIKAFRILDAASLKPLAAYRTAGWLLDSYVAGQPGGTGRHFNWDLALQAKQSGRPIILAGGLTPENVAEAVRRVQPFAVDVSSGVESAPGRKDAALTRAFVVAVRDAARSL